MNKHAFLLIVSGAGLVGACAEPFYDDDIGVEEAEFLDVGQHIRRSPASRRGIGHDHRPLGRRAKLGLQDRREDLALIILRTARRQTITQYQNPDLVGIGLPGGEIIASH